MALTLRKRPILMRMLPPLDLGGEIDGERGVKFVFIFVTVLVIGLLSSEHIRTPQSSRGGALSYAASANRFLSSPQSPGCAFWSTYYDMKSCLSLLW